MSGLPPRFARDGLALMGNGTAYYIVDKVRKYQRNHSDIEYGNYLLSNNIRAGNCGEMLAVAAKIIGSRFPAAKIGVAALSAKDIDHALLIVGNFPKSANAAQWEQIEESFNARVVDVWAGICCHVREYPALLREKMEKWSSREKYIVTVPDQNGERIVAFHRAAGKDGNPETDLSGYVNPADPGYIDGLLYGNLQIFDAKSV